MITEEQCVDDSCGCKSVCELRLKAYNKPVELTQDQVDSFLNLHEGKSNSAHSFTEGAIILPPPNPNEGRACGMPNYKSMENVDHPKLIAIREWVNKNEHLSEDCAVVSSIDLMLFIKKIYS